MIALVGKVIPKPAHTDDYFGDATRLKSTRHPLAVIKLATELK